MFHSFWEFHRSLFNNIVTCRLNRSFLRNSAVNRSTESRLTHSLQKLNCRHNIFYSTIFPYGRSQSIWRNKSSMTVFQLNSLRVLLSALIHGARSSNERHLSSNTVTMHSWLWVLARSKRASLIKKGILSHAWWATVKAQNQLCGWRQADTQL